MIYPPVKVEIRCYLQQRRIVPRSAYLPTRQPIPEVLYSLCRVVVAVVRRLRRLL